MCRLNRHGPCFTAPPFSIVWHCVQLNPPLPMFTSPSGDSTTVETRPSKNGTENGRCTTSYCSSRLLMFAIVPTQ